MGWPVVSADSCDPGEPPLSTIADAAAPAADAATPAHGYRPHLDGIRALAVVAVILFHLGYRWIPGGFVGVDVFFVLSGYLITGLLVGEVEGRGTIRLGRFYARRVRRLLPASIAVLATVLVTSRPFFDAIQRWSLGWDASFAALYSANWRFALVGGDYFAPGDIPSPLVHFWSLAVEEQFYLVWPALVLVLHRLGTRVRRSDPLGFVLGAVGVLGLASAVVSVAAAGDPLTYYGTHARAYQLLAGAALAVVVRRQDWRLPEDRVGRVSGWALTVAGLVVLGWSAVTVRDASHYPGWPGVWVTVASVALVAGVDLAPAGWVTRLVGHRAMAAVGRLSYSLYIWHWPVVVLAPVVAARWGGRWSHAGNRGVMVVVIVVLAVVSYHLVERPIRFRLRPATRPLPVVAVGLCCSLVVAVAAYPAFGPQDRFADRARAAVRDFARPGACPYFVEDWPAAADAEPCVIRDGSGPVVALVGDSHAQQWQPALELLAERSDAKIVRATRAGCPANDVTPVLRQPSGQVEVADACTAWRRRLFRAVVDDFDPAVVIVATRSHGLGLRVDGADVAPRDPGHVDAWAAGWDWTLDTLAAGGASVVVSEILPTMPERIPACLLAHGEADADACTFALARDRVVGRYNEVIAALDGRVDGRVRVIRPVTFVCPGGSCPALIDDVIVHRDDNHLSVTFVRAQVDAWAALLSAAGVTL